MGNHWPEADKLAAIDGTERWARVSCTVCTPFKAMKKLSKFFCCLKMAILRGRGLPMIVRGNLPNNLL